LNFCTTIGLRTVCYFFRALQQEPGIADADFLSMGTTTALKNIIGGGVCKFDGSSSDCTHRKGIVCCPSFQEPSPKQVSLLP
jgi:hypothetical protein